MATHHSTPPIRGGERPRLSSAQRGPVTIALAAMRAADPDLERHRIRDLRRRIAERIEADIALLDTLDGDCDLEDGHDAEGLTDDNGLGDTDAFAEQGFPGYGKCA